MSHLLYLYAIDWASYENVFVHPKKATIDAVVAAVNVPHLREWVIPGLTVERVAAFAPRVLGKNAVNRAKLPAGDRKLFDAIEGAAFRTKKAGIRLKPISANGMGAGFFDEEFTDAFAGKKAKALLATLRSDTFVMSPASVAAASKTLASLDVDDDDGLFAEELVKPFAKAAKKKQGVRGVWG